VWIGVGSAILIAVLGIVIAIVIWMRRASQSSDYSSVELATGSAVISLSSTVTLEYSDFLNPVTYVDASILAE
jgi:ABC-type phosphate transport system substrate-binding protein